MGFFFQQLYSFFRQRPWLLWLILAMSAGVLAYRASRLHLQEDITRLVPADERTATLLRILQEGQLGEGMVLHLYRPDHAGEDQTTDLQAFADSLSDALLTGPAEPYVAAIRSRVDEAELNLLYDSLYAHLPLWLPDSLYDQLAERLEEDRLRSQMRSAYRMLMTPAGFAARKYMFADPLQLMPEVLAPFRQLQVDEDLNLANGYIMTGDRRHLLMFLDPAQPVSESRKNTELLRLVDSTLVSLQRNSFPELEAEYFGAMPMAVANASRIKADVALTMSIAGLLLFLLVGMYFRRWYMFVLLVVPIAFGAVGALAGLELLRTEVSLVALGIGAVLLGICMDYSIHFFTHLKLGGSTSHTLRDVTRPVLISSVTTMAAFLCLWAVRSEGMHDLGLFAALSVILSALFALLILPHLGDWLGQLGKSGKERPNPVETLLDRLAGLRLRRPLIWVPVLALFTGIFWWGSREVGFQSSIDDLNYVPPHLQKAESNLNDLFQYKLKVVYLYATGKDLNEAARQRDAAMPLIERLNNEGLVAKYNTTSGILLSDSVQAARIARWEGFWTEDRKEKLRRDLANISGEYGIKSEVFEPFFKLVDRDYEVVGNQPLAPLRDNVLRPYLTEMEGEVALATMLRVREADKEAVYAALDARPELLALDKQYMVRTFVQTLREDFDWLVGLTLLVVFLLVSHLFGRIELGLIVMAPILISWVWTLGIMGWTGLNFNIFNIIITSFVFGLGVDFSVFVMHGLLDRYKYGRDELKSYKSAILLSATTTLMGMGALAFARHPAMQSIAWISMIGIITSMMAALLLEPVLFRWLVRRRDGQPRWAPIVWTDILLSIWGFSVFLFGVILLSIALLLIRLLPIPRKRAQLGMHYILMYMCRFLVWLIFPIKKKRMDVEPSRFDRPAMIVSNHQSHLDLLMILSLHPRIIILTKEWVWRNVFYGRIIRFLEFYPLTDGVDAYLDKLEAKVNEGYSLMVFPEGSRSPNCRIRRFHKGAFFLAEKFKLPIQPVLLHGIGHGVPKGENYVKTGQFSIAGLPIVEPPDTGKGITYQQRTKEVQSLMRQAYAKLRQILETPQYFRSRLIKNYLYKGPVIEWYLRVKIRLEHNYDLFHELVPRSGRVVDLGCGYGFMAYMLRLCGPGREVIGYDADVDKVAVAQHCGLRDDGIRFEAMRLQDADLPEADCFIMADVLHYLPPDDQVAILHKCWNNLKPGGRIIVRDGDSGQERAHRRTRLTEWFSTVALRFNIMPSDALFFFSERKLRRTFDGMDARIEVAARAKGTSNTVYVIGPKGIAENRIVTV